MYNGKDLIKIQAENAPERPGVYRMLDQDKKIIYIGKAKSLRSRLTQYTLELSGKSKIMVSLTCAVEYSVTDNEAAALILEAQLIRKFKPKFNILLKDDKSFPYIKLRLDHKFPQLLKYRGNNLSDSKFFGPFASVKQVEITLLELQRIFKLRSCSDSYFSSRKRPCLQYQIKKCYAPCVSKISEEDYASLVLEVKTFLSGKTHKLQNLLSSKMEELSTQMRYEEAAEIRDKIRALNYIQLKGGSGKEMVDDADIIAAANYQGVCCIQLFIYRANQPCGNQDYFPAHTQEENISNVLESFLLQLYQTKVPPKKIFLSHEIKNTKLISEALYQLHGVNVKISMPKIGHKLKLIEIAIENAQLSLDRHLKNSAKNIAALQAVQNLFNLPKLLERIEVYDNSHIQGAFAVGAMIVVGVGGFDKKEYRLFTIKEEATNPHGGGDDYAMLREVLNRRFTRLKKELERIPDLMIIDGGKGHMSIVSEIMNKFNVNIPFICMSKGIDRNAGKEQFYFPGRKSFTLDKNSSVMKYLQILRDEVHKFAIKSHRKKRSSAIKYSSLDQIEGIGITRKKALLNYFGSFKEISNATALELTKVKGISKALAIHIYTYLH